jgi:hypothetical protein
MFFPKQSQVISFLIIHQSNLHEKCANSLIIKG